VAATTLLLIACGRTPHASSPSRSPQHIAAAELVDAVPPAGSNAAEPFLSATRNGVLLSWLEPVPGSDRTAFRYSRYERGQWTPARTLLERNDLFVNWADFPSIVEDADGALFAHWLQKHGSGAESYDVHMAVARDGQTWGEPFLLNRDAKEGEHGFVTLAALRHGGVAATWLDGRNMTSGGMHGDHGAGAMTVRYAEIQADGSLETDEVVDTRTCECCTTGIALAEEGPVIVYRDRTPDEIRDVYAVRRTGAVWAEPHAVHADGWKINGCPVNGPQIDASGKRVVTAWFTAAHGTDAVYAAFSTDGGATFGKAVRIDGGQPVGRVDVLFADDNSAIVSWVERVATGAEIRIRRVSFDGTLDVPLKVADSSSGRASGFTRMARKDAEIWLAWTDQNGPSKKVRVARVII
jgi:hypothetical protein